jgi:hypothetical protein
MGAIRDGEEKSRFLAALGMTIQFGRSAADEQ